MILTEEHETAVDYGSTSLMTANIECKPYAFIAKMFHLQIQIRTPHTASYTHLASTHTDSSYGKDKGMGNFTALDSYSSSYA
jgi:hypothetical protein